ncbi:Ig-like domain-containing protein [Alkalimonas collagenimarina]|uniref:Ig-like domain-containing protein n=1 Tax=Alkalimonas collagenimarina TaxID=400390 RepID=A0ABT9H318_9GAMM|nr:Ig-like domain-containing protein [Alkalimonas collagenimarina]MDP4537717.1 Ig-like domain-containing protein [Alkalimonas collagenimarina]
MRNIQLSITAVFFSLLLVACGGGGTLDGGGNGGTGTAPVFTLELELNDSAGAASDQLSDAEPLTARATLSATNNGTISGRVIVFEFSSEGLATLSASSGTALTDSSGVAEIELRAGDISGAGELRATLQNTDTSAAAGFNSAGDGGGESGITIASVRLLADRTQLGSGASDKIELSALVRDSNNVLLSGVPVTFSSDSGELIVTSAETEQDGIAKATLTSQIDKSVRDIVVSARVNNIRDELLLRVVGTTLEVVAPSAVVLGDHVAINFSLQDAAGQGIANEVLTVSSELGNPLSQTSPMTGSNGQVSITYDAVSSGDDTLLVAALGLNQSVSLSVKADSFVFLANSDNEASIPEVDLNTARSMELEWLTDNIPNANRNVLFSTTRGSIASSEPDLSDQRVVTESMTDADGKAEVFVQSSFAGLATISARGGDNEISTQKVVEFIAVNPVKMEVQAFPAQLVQGDSSSIRAIVRDENNNPVKNQLVAFSLDNSAGGSISSGTATTNSQGVATTSFTADLTTGAGVEGENLIISASLVSNSGVTDSTDIAVGGRTLFFRFGTGNTIESPSASLYRKEFSIIVTDASGNPVANQPLNVAAVSLRYRKGIWIKDPPPPESFTSWVTDVTAGCMSEDVNFNGILDIEFDGNGDPIPGSGEDTNGDGLLTPGNLATVPSTVTSNADGIAVFHVTYPRDVAPWLDVRLQVSGFAAGTENMNYREFTLTPAASDLTTETVAPPANPFGQSGSCSDAL